MNNIFMLRDHQETCLRCQKNSVPSPTNCYEGYIFHVIMERAEKAELEIERLRKELEAKIEIS